MAEEISEILSQSNTGLQNPCGYVILITEELAIILRTGEGREAFLERLEKDKKASLEMQRRKKRAKKKQA